MESEKKKCSLEKHKEKDACSYCAKCEKYMCKKCENIHAEFFESKHSLFIYNENNFENIKNYIDITELDQIQIEENIKYLKDFSKKLKEKIEKLKNELKKLEQNKEDLTTKILKYFTKLRNTLNQAEDELLQEIEDKFQKSILNQELKKNESLLNKINLALNKNLIKLEPLINECKDIVIKNEDINNYNTIDIIMPNEEGINEINERIKTIGSVNKIIFNSSIIKNDLKKLNLINDWIKEKMDKDSLKYELIFKMTENGSSSQDFHKYCNNQGATLTLIKTTGNLVFGGFTPIDWGSKGACYDRSKRTFVFSLNLMKKYNLKNNSEYAIYCNEEYGPTFGYEKYNKSSAIYFYQFLEEGETYANENSNFFPTNSLELTQGKGDFEEFETIEIEVFKII